MFQDLHITPKQQANIFATGFLVIITLGTLASIGLCIAALWLLVELGQLLLTAIIECCQSIGATYQAADPLVRFLILVSIGFVVYCIVRHFRQSRGA